MDIIGYIHVCQKGQWKRSLGMLMDCIKKSKLYEHIKKIRVGIVNDNAVYIGDEIFKDPIFEIIYVKQSSKYERPTLRHMREK